LTSVQKSPKELTSHSAHMTALISTDLSWRDNTKCEL